MGLILTERKWIHWLYLIIVSFVVYIGIVKTYFLRGKPWFPGSTEITAAMDTWYSNETEVVFACGGGIFTSAAEAAAKVNGKIIGVDSDQSPIIDKYGKGMTVTSAMKSLTATVNARLDSIIFDGTWKDHVGQVENLGLEWIQRNL